MEWADLEWADLEWAHLEWAYWNGCPGIGLDWFQGGQGFDADVGFRNAAQRSCAAVILYNSVRRGVDPSIICTGNFARTIVIRKCGTCGKC